MFKVTTSGNFSKTMTSLDRMRRGVIYATLDSAGMKGVQALSEATPKETGLTASSWDYRIVKERKRIKIEWFNTNDVEGNIIAVLIQYGHGTGDGTWVEGRDYINPAMAPVFDKIAADMWRQVTK